MLGILKKLDIVSLLQTPLDQYGIGKQPRRGDVIKQDDAPKSTANQVFNGKQYVAKSDPGAATIDWETVDTKSQKPTGTKQKHITGWDKAFLDVKFGVGKWNVALATVVKVHWFDGDSAATIESKHRDRGGVLEFGFSERNVKMYTFAFNRALEKELEELENETVGAMGCK